MKLKEKIRKDALSPGRDAVKKTGAADTGFIQPPSLESFVSETIPATAPLRVKKKKAGKHW